MTDITNTHFGSLTKGGLLGWHKTWDECYRAWFNLLIRDGENIDLFTNDELSIIRAAAEKPVKCEYLPIFEHGDLGWHNMIWGCIGDTPDSLHAIDFGNARFLPSHLTVWGYSPFGIPGAQYLIKILIYCYYMSLKE